MTVRKSTCCAAAVLLVAAGHNYVHALSEAGQVSRCERAKAIVTLYIGAVETARAIESYSRKDVVEVGDVLADGELFRRTFGSSRIDKNGAIWVREIPNHVFEGACFFEASVAFVSPPERIFSVGVLPTGQVIRFRGFSMTDGFAELLARCKKVAGWSAIDMIRLFYRLKYSENPGPLTSEKEVAAARRDLVAAGATAGEIAVCLLPQIRKTRIGKLVTVAIYDGPSTRLERHEVLVARDGNVKIVTRKVVRDFGRVRR